MKPSDLLAGQPDLPRDLLTLADQLAATLRGSGAIVTDVGYDLRAQRAELIAETPSQARIEFTLRLL